MSSFKRRAPSSQPPPPIGTRANSATSTVREVSTGVPSLDDILGGGQPLGSLLILLAPDPHSAWGELLLRYWIAQGLVVDQDVCVVSGEGIRLVEGCMWLSPRSTTEEEEDDTRDETKVKIAWRYENMKRVETTVSSKVEQEYSHTFDLTQKIPQSVVKKAEEDGRLTMLNLEDGTTYDGVLGRIRALLSARNGSEGDSASSTSQPPRRVLRLAIPNLGGPEWGDSNPTDILRFLYILRSIVQSTPTVVLVTLPSHLSQASPAFDSGQEQADSWITKLGFLSDGCLSFSSFGADPVLATTFPTYHGFVHIHKAPSIQSLVPPSHKLSVLRGLSSQVGGGGENNLGFRCSRKRFVIETLHLDVEGGVSERRTAPPISAGLHEDSTKPVKEPGAAKVAVEAPLVTEETTKTSEKPKKPRKVVAFRSEGKDLYDF